ncbi:MAG: hypothetical protein H6734_13300 [Alphaproteobacteria bacterium]|nr:hypothetical protein [Alphaproteobacteria bacterium]
MIPADLDDDALAVWADARQLEGDVLGEIVALQLAGRAPEGLLQRHAPVLLGPLHGLIVPPGTWEKARLVGVELVGIDPTPVLEGMRSFPSVRTLDFGTHTPLAPERRRVWGHEVARQLREVRFRMPATWLRTYRRELLHAPVQRFVVVLDVGTLAFERRPDGFRLVVAGLHPLVDRAVAHARQALPIREVVRSVR